LILCEPPHFNYAELHCAISVFKKRLRSQNPKERRLVKAEKRAEIGRNRAFPLDDLHLVGYDSKKIVAI